jgi:hypothetical protein
MNPMPCFPRWWIASVYFVASVGLLNLTRDMAVSGWPKLFIAAEGAGAAMFFIGFAVHLTKLALGAWRARRA